MTDRHLTFTLPDALGHGYRLLTVIAGEERCLVQSFAANGQAEGLAREVTRDWLERELVSNEALLELEAIDRMVP